MYFSDIGVSERGFGVDCQFLHVAVVFAFLFLKLAVVKRKFKNFDIGYRRVVHSRVPIPFGKSWLFHCDFSFTVFIEVFANSIELGSRSVVSQHEALAGECEAKCACIFLNSNYIFHGT